MVRQSPKKNPLQGLTIGGYSKFGTLTDEDMDNYTAIAFFEDTNVHITGDSSGPNNDVLCKAGMVLVIGQHVRLITTDADVYIS